jgi:biotin-[acetyl-CoA-carboxylase] ligase BirA-like protein
VTARINVGKLQENLQTKKLGKGIVFLCKTDSTNDYASNLAEWNAAEGTVVVAGTQGMGRGRLGRSWASPAGGLWFSVILRPKLKPAEAWKLMFVASLAVADTLNALYGLKIEIKWPNDLLVDGKKVCGILSEMSSVTENVNFVVVGIGINANLNVRKAFSKQLKNDVTSLRDELGHDVWLEQLLKSLLEVLEARYEVFINHGWIRVLSDWKKYAAFLGCNVRVEDQGVEYSGLAVDVDDDGALVLRLKNGKLRRFLVGDIHLYASQVHLKTP